MNDDMKEEDELQSLPENDDPLYFQDGDTMETY